jgi:cation transport ATPase
MLKPTLVSSVALDGRDADTLLALATGAAPDGHTVVVGDGAHFAALGLSIERLSDWPERLRQRGQRVVFVALDGCTIGLLGVVDAE